MTTRPSAPVDAAPADSPDVEAVRRLQPVKRPVAVAAVAAVILGVIALLYSWSLPPFDGPMKATDDAYVRGQVTLMAPQVNGYVVQVLVQDFEHVIRGQLLVKIDDRIYRQRVEQAAANVAARQADLANALQAQRSKRAALGSRLAEQFGAEAELAKAKADLARISDLATDGSVSLREKDQAVAALHQAEAGVRQSGAADDIARQDIRSVDVARDGLVAAVAAAQAALHLAQIDLDNTAIRAPSNGQLSEIGVRLGQYVSAGSPLLSLVPASLWVTANYKEAQTAKIEIGQKARIRVDGLGGVTLLGHVEEISPATGSEFAVLKPENASGNFIKVAQRIPVRIALDAGQPLAARLRPGMSVEAQVNTASPGSRR